MSKAKLKKALEVLDKEDIIGVITDLYEARKDAKEWLEFWLDPNPRKACDKAKSAVRRVFFASSDTSRRRPSLANLNKISKDFTTLCFDKEEIADFLIYVAETETEWLEGRYRRITYRSSLRKNINAAVLYCEDNFPEGRFNLRLGKLKERASSLYYYDADLGF